MKVNRSDLLTILSSLRPGVAKKEVPAQAGHFIFTGTAICTFNDQICITHPYETEEVFSVKAEDFYKMLNGISAPEVVIEPKKGKIIVTAPGVKAQLNIGISDSEKVEQYITDLQESMIDWYPVPEDFLAGMNLVAFSAAKSVAMGALACIYTKGNRMYTGDNWRMSRYTMKAGINHDLLILAKDALELIKFPITDYCLADNWIHFLTSDGATFSCRRVMETHKVSDTFFAVPKDAVEDEFPKGMKEVIESMSFINADIIDIERYVTVAFSGDNIVCKVEGNSGWIEKTLEHKSENPFKFDANPNFLKDVLGLTNKVHITEGKAYFSAENFDHAMCLIVEV